MVIISNMRNRHFSQDADTKTIYTVYDSRIREFYRSANKNNTIFGIIIEG